MRHARLWRVLSILIVTMIPATLWALEPSQGKDKPDKANNEKKEDRGDHREPSGLIAVLSAGISISYEEARDFAVESNMTGYKPLPPGIRKNLARGKPIPPGIRKTRFPSSFVDRLPAHDGYEWHMAGTDLVLVFKADLTISGVLRDVFK